MRSLLVAIIVLIGIIAGLITGGLSRCAGAHPAKAVLNGAAGCAGTITLGLLLLDALSLP